jgi:hypothetical protein
MWIAQRRQKTLHGFGTAAWPLSVIRLSRVEQQQRIPSRSGVEDHESVFTLRDGVGERSEDGDLLDARTAQILFEHCLSLSVE